MSQIHEKFGADAAAKNTLSAGVARAYEAQRHELSQALVVAQVGPLLAAEESPMRRARLLTRAAAAVGAGHAVLLVLDDRGHHLIPISVFDGISGPAEPFMGNVSNITAIPQARPLLIGEGLIGLAARDREVILVPDLAADSRFDPDMAAPDAEIFGMAPSGIICIPLLDRDQFVGVLAVAQPIPARGFDLRSVELLRSLAAQATLMLAAEAREHASMIAQQRLTDAQDELRRRLAHNLETGPAQQVSQTLTSLEHLDLLIEHDPHAARAELRCLYTNLSHTMRDLRGTLFDLRPLTLETEGLLPVLGQLVDHTSACGVRVHLIADLPERLPLAIESAIYVVVREALDNVVRHARARECTVDVRRRSGVVKAIIRDNGVGFDPEHVLASYPHGECWGLITIYERVRSLTDQFVISSRPGRGTAIEFEIPLASAQ